MMLSKKDKKKTTRKNINVEDISISNYIPNPSTLEFVSDPQFQPITIPINEKRDRIMLEFVETEQSYVRDLCIIQYVYKRPMLAASNDGLLPYSDVEIDKIFGNIEEIYGVNKQLLVDILDLCRNWSPQQCIGKKIKDLMFFLRIYTVYSINYNESINILNSYEHKEIVTEFFNALRSLSFPGGGHDIKSYLIKPIQRIPRYRLLIEDFIKNTDDSHPDKPLLDEALELIKSVADEVNVSITKHEQSEKLYEISQKLIFDNNFEILIGGRSFKMEGILTKVCRKENKVRHFFLFNDLLLYAYPYGNKFKVGEKFDLSRTRVTNVRDMKNNKMVIENGIQIESEKKSFIVLCETPEEKRKWLINLQNTIKELREKNDTLRKIGDNEANIIAPVWVPDDQAKTCSICAIKFTLTNRRHHCRQCGNVVCNECSRNKKEIPRMGKVRVCDSCKNKSISLAPEDESFDSVSDMEELETVLCVAKAKYDYNAPNGTDTSKLSFKAGDEIEIIKRDESGWWLGVRLGEQGWVPASFLEIIV